MYDVSGGTGDRNCVVLNDIHIDIMDYIVPATCTDSDFRQMWAEFEWENKVNCSHFMLRKSCVQSLRIFGYQQAHRPYAKMAAFELFFCSYSK